MDLGILTNIWSLGIKATRSHTNLLKPITEDEDNSSELHKRSESNFLEDKKKKKSSIKKTKGARTIHMKKHIAQTKPAENNTNNEIESNNNKFLSSIVDSSLQNINYKQSVINQIFDKHFAQSSSNTSSTSFISDLDLSKQG